MHAVNRQYMVNFIAALFLLVGGIKLAGSWTRLIQDNDFLFAVAMQDENSKEKDGETKEKPEQEPAVVEPGSLFPTPAGTLIKSSFAYYWHLPSHYEEPVSPPPDII